ncbi:hypothetical protein LRQ11_10595 [Pseudomonas sp. MAFF 311095]|uniref:Uncharacterized protein n=1 Tax=Pseudomonas petroselini TaxID=2899822 RepID=A0ABS8QNC1_9PSED|nr:hypothetical protein [Pseudomonas petroselini]MCD7037164.1 hypothetical protein [Pseudomonas petroselini]MCD7044641.1 hypothetical protein [Pseudomonas petroselini]MCD7066709.1 hypothetical protein [Pseudomonas petroselini]MCD7079294.1 hypothetical protein [Pseudomonas petroselini]
MTDEFTSIVLGDECDAVLRNALHVVLVRLGAVGIDKSWTVEGSQEIEVAEVELMGGKVKIELEAFVGLTVFGHEFVVDELADKLV